MKKEVAIIMNTEGEIIGCFKCKMVDEQEYAELHDKTLEIMNTKDEKVSELKLNIRELKDEIDNLKREIKTLKGEE